MSSPRDPSTSASGGADEQGRSDDAATPGRSDDAVADPGAGPGAAGETGPSTRSAPRVGPRAMRKPERGETSVRDLIGAVLILIPVALLIFSVGGSCSFAPTGPVEDPDSGPTVNVEARLADFARGSAFPLRVPEVPFRANSADRGPVEGGGTAVRIGYVTPGADYLSLVQTDASVEGVLVTESGAAGRGEGPPLRQGTIDAGGLTWETYQREGGEPFRVTTLPGAPEVRVLVTGSAPDEDFRTLAGALSTARTLPTGT
ncbi:hypothetical protein Ae168Ps1_4116 [Pseudonocardia sp. Ae168_Ps1]|uniref:DUF4245 domain-containing protein n=1 Tax=unclassified Pseudonocardia TaxID=2619320 RepID=UPI00094B2DAD|nr:MULTISPECIES: DUF4245 domain-containing protein [unclassified Pseudonocardia]OLL75711.1 hypothetical protein Ae150APs1_4089 [Pseudonocardia sp. Ae150A_Ps1]OLL81710.1 hypothetical protein Ae168Ps1_4116 [Pseudonocardia sp. Ae168_Ps1]OLL84177.1 hypothetical protein Ae263Ps1_1232c [Pseudonocardia sp. Ae263_Ps1]OLL95805.1 hypothetical protein Ae356Ps1_5702 [Pseudonocardia sp. Ae356_Ps1]